MNQAILKNTEALKEKMAELDALSDYYDEIFAGTTKDDLMIGKEKMRYLRTQILKKTFEAKNIIGKMQLEENSKKTRK